MGPAPTSRAGTAVTRSRGTGQPRCAVTALYRTAEQFERSPPQDLAAEQSVLGGMLLSKDAIADVVEILTRSDFYRPAHQPSTRRSSDLYGRGEPADR